MAFCEEEMDAVQCVCLEMLFFVQVKAHSKGSLYRLETLYQRFLLVVKLGRCLGNDDVVSGLNMPSPPGKDDACRVDSFGAVAVSSRGRKHSITLSSSQTSSAPRITIVTHGAHSHSTPQPPGVVGFSYVIVMA